MPTKENSKFVTNTKNNSVHVIKLPVIKFKDLWANYPKNAIKHSDPETGKDLFSDHCAIHVSESLVSSGAKSNSFNGAKCWNCPKGSSVHILRAQEMADWLAKKPFVGCPAPMIMSGTDFKAKCKNKTGIIFFKDYWQRGGEEGTQQRTGDHIDLWNDGTLAGSGVLGSFIRITLGIAHDGIWSDFEKSTQVRFWEIK